MAEKAWHQDDYRVLVGLLKQRRQKAGVTQVQLAEMLGQSQSYVSKIENGDLRLDILQVRKICQLYGCSFLGLVKELDAKLEH